MADVNIKASITVDTGNTESKVQGVQTGMEKAGKTIQDTGNKTKETSGHFGKLKEGLGNLPGPVGSVVSAFDGLKKAFVAIIMNPVGLVLAAIVATLGLLYAAFTNTFAGGQKVEQIFAGIKATAQSLLDNLDKVGSAIKNVFTFNFSAAKKDLQDIGNAAVVADLLQADKLVNFIFQTTQYSAEILLVDKSAISKCQAGLFFLVILVIMQ
jgi:phage-related minor tail protein